jgi:hypothetical protein
MIWMRRAASRVTPHTLTEEAGRQVIGEIPAYGDTDDATSLAAC